MKTKIFQWLLLVCKFVQFIVGLLPGDDGDSPGDRVKKEEGRSKKEEVKRKK